MKNELPVKYQGGFFFRIKMFFSDIFKKRAVIEPIEEVSENKIEIKPEVLKTEIKAEMSEFDKMKAESKKVKVKEDILTMVDKNPELIESLSIEKLRLLESMYDEMIEKNEMKIKQLKSERL